MNYIVYELCQPNHSGSVVHTKTGSVRRYPPSHSIPGEILTMDDKGEPRMIRYVTSQTEIYADSQQNVGDMSVKKPRFENGILFVRESQKGLIKFLDKHPWNEANQGMGLPRQKPVFRKRDVVKMLQKSNADKTKKFNAVKTLLALDFENKVKPIASYLGFDIYGYADGIMHDMMTFAEQNPEQFVELASSPIVDRHYVITRASKLGILRLAPNTISWPDGRHIVQVPQNYNPVQYMAEISFDQNYQGTWSEIVRQLEKVGTHAPAEETIANPDSIGSELNNLTAEALFERAKDLKAIQWEKPNPGDNFRARFKFAGHTHHSKAEFVEAIEKNPDLKSLIVASLVSLSQ